MTTTYVNTIVNALTVNLAEQPLYFDKLAPAAATAGVAQSLWTATGQPLAGTYPTTGVANGRACSRTTTGAPKYTVPTAPSLMYLMNEEGNAVIASSTGKLYLVDRLADVQIALLDSTSSITGCDGTARLAATSGQGDGGFLFIETSAALSAAADTFTLEYTNQVGATAKVTPTITTVASRAVGSSATAFFWQPLAAGDTGVRAVTKYTLGTGTATGNFCVAIMKILAEVPLLTPGLAVARNMTNNVPSIPQIVDGACLQLMWYPDAGSTPLFFGEIDLLEF